MMKRIVIWGLLGLLPLAGASAGNPKVVDQFSADQLMTVGDSIITTRIYVARGNVRSETVMPGLPEPSVTIINGARKVVWVLMPGGMYLERSIDIKEDMSNAAWADPNLLEPVGKETIDGVECEVFRVKAPDQDILYYVRASDRIPVRMSSQTHNVRVDWKNVKVGPQPANLFELPPGAKKFGLPGGFKIPGLQ
ncbi:MAG: DUF4412 domain-containing protein [Kiritimatiellae bacterium]|nr:DUF4412 domain-containing protein [Kiritimatiellia bacterium]MDW8458771.1 hypothetical protein [Verrucomicrobiota bacterium]